MRILITAGPTREYLDDVRFLSNASTGRMGYALAAAALQAGHEAVLVSGPVALEPPLRCEFHSVESSRDMYLACLSLFPACDGAIAAAAVCDYTPLRRVTGKISKTGGNLTLELVETSDVVAELGRRKQHRWIVGFALEAQHAHENAVRKLNAKNCDAIVLNSPAAIGAEQNSIELIDKTGRTVANWTDGKAVIAQSLIAWIESSLSSSPRAP